MAEVELRSLRVSAQMDASQYAAGAQQKVAADKAMVASGQQAAQATSATVTKISQAGDVLQQLSRKYVDGYAAAQRFNSELLRLSSGLERGKITMQQADVILAGMARRFGLMGDEAQFAAKGQTEFAASISRTNAALREQEALARGRGSGRVPLIPREQQFVPPWGSTPPPANQNNQGGLARFGSMNATSQFQDIAVTAAMGQSPMTIALQQGTQLGMAMQMQMGDQGAKGVIKGLGSAFMGLLTPINLVAIGLTGAAALAIQYFTSGAEKSKLLDESLQKNVKSINAITNAYHMAGVSADDLQRKSIAASEADERRTEKELEAQIRLEQKRFTANTKPTDLMTFGMLGDNSADVAPEFAAFTDPIRQLRKEIEAQAKGEGKANFDAFFQQIDQIANTGPGAFTGFVNELVRSTGVKVESYSDIRDRLYEMGGAARQAARQLELVIEVQRKIDQENTRQGLQDQRGLGRYVRTRDVQDSRESEQFAASQQMARARTNAERLAAVEAEARAKFPSQADEGGGRNARVERALQEERLRQQMELKDAQDARNRSLDRTLSSARVDVDLVGKTTAEVEGLRMAAQLEAEVREQAAIKGVAVDQAEIAMIRQKSAEYGKLLALEQARSKIFDQTQDIELQKAELGLIGQSTLAHDRAIASLKAEQEIRRLGIDLYGKEANEIRQNTAELAALAEASAKARIQQDLLFEIRQAGRSQADQSVASQLRSAGLPEDLDSDIAKVIRMKDQIASMKETWEEVFQTASDGIDGVVDALFDGGDIGDALKKLGRDFARQMFDLAATNPLKNWLTGSNLPSIGDMGIFGSGASSGKGGGFGGVLGNLLGAQKAVASMQVQAASVFINGAPIGVPGIGSIGNLINPDGSSIAGPNTQASSARLLAGLGSPLGLGVDGTTTGASAARLSSTLGTAPFSEMLAFARQAASVRGIDPEIALRVMRHEGLNPGIWQSNVINGAGLRETSYGPMQLLKGGGLGDAFQRETGLNVADPATWRQNIEFGLNKAATGGWGSWYGARAAGVGNFDGLRGASPVAIDKFSSALGQATTSVGQLGGASTGALSNLVSSTSQAAGGLSTLGSGAGKLGSMLSQFPAAPAGGGGGGGGGLFGWLGGLFGGGGGGIGSFSAGVQRDFASGALGLGLFADGTENAPPGWAVVGEKGPELRKLRAGDVIRSNPRSMEMMKQAGRGSNDNLQDFVRMLAPHLKSNTKVINVFDPSVVGDYLGGPDGERVIMNVLRRNGK